MSAHAPRPGRRRATLVGSAVAAVIAQLIIGPATGSGGSASAAPAPPAGNDHGNYVPAACNTAAGTTPAHASARCYAEGLAAPDGKLIQNASEPPATAISPAELQSAYRLPNGGSGQTVAIVDAFGYDTAESDLAVFRAHYGLPACTSANGCFVKVDENGGTDYPAQDEGWSVETSLDLDAVSAACPKCNILLVQATDAGSNNLGAAVDTAAAMGADAISNSYGIAGEVPFETDFDHYYDHPGIAVTASTGDLGGLQSYPATDPDVVAVGGTFLQSDSSARGWSETAWADGGSGCSLYEARPDYQQDVSTGCTDTRATADVSADADPESGLAVYNTFGQDGWAQWGGTSLASPLVAAMYALAGKAVPGTYPVTYPYRSNASLNDVTGGSNSNCGDVECTAGKGWDGPTGLGTPSGVSALTLGPSGSITGNITNAASHNALADATVTATGADGYTFHTTTDGSGNYSLPAAVGAYDLVASKFSYRSATVHVSVSPSASIQENFALAHIAGREVSGTVTDASGQGWPVYAAISIDGDPGGPVYSDPYTGKYQVELPVGDSYTLHVAPVDLPGYSSTTTTVDVPAAKKSNPKDVRRNVALQVDTSSCDAPGYAYSYQGTSTGFEGWGDGPGDGWQVTDDAGTGKTWSFTDPGSKGNLTGGTGGFAIVDGWYQPGDHDTSLISPSVDLSGQSKPEIGFDTDYSAWGDQTADVYLSLDDGTTWTDVWHASDTDVQGHVDIAVPQAAGRSGVRVKFRYTGGYDNWWELDNVFVGARSCDATGGGLIAGVVRDDNTGTPLVGASVSADKSTADPAISQATPDDAHVPDGYYWLYSQNAGTTKLTATDRDYAAGSATVQTAARQIVRHNWRLAAGQLTVQPGAISVSEKPGRVKTQKLRLTNSGTEPLHVSVLEQDRGYTAPAGQHQTTAPGAPLLRRSAAGVSAGAFATWHAPSGTPSVLSQRPAAAADAAWSNISDLPTPTMDNVVADNDGLVYSVAGVTDGGVTAQGYVYDPGTGSWSRIADLPQALDAPVGAFVDGRLYVTGGWSATGDSLSATYAYDPGADSWSQVADLPSGLSAGAATAVNGNLYVVGGCTTGACETGSTSTYRYDPATDTWSTLASYPIGVAFLACAAAGDGLVCAGGIDPVSGLGVAATYRYIAGSDAWTQVADMPYTDWGMAYAGAGGKLQVMGGIVGDNVSNQAAEFDPDAGVWSALPNVNDALYRAGGTCGVYKIGGATSGFSATPYAEQLPGHDACAEGSDVAWLSESSTEITVPAGRTVTVLLTLDSSSLSAAGTYDARLAFTTDTPYQVPPVTVALRVS